MRREDLLRFLRFAFGMTNSYTQLKLLRVEFTFFWHRLGGWLVSQMHPSFFVEMQRSLPILVFYPRLRVHFFAMRTNQNRVQFFGQILR